MAASGCEPEGCERFFVPAEAVLCGLDLERVAQEADPAMPRRGKVHDGLSRPADVVGGHGIGVEEAGRTVDEHERCAGALLRLEVAVVGASRHDEDAVDATRAERLDQLTFPPWILVAAPGQDEHSALPGAILDGPVEGGGERIGDVLQDETHGLGLPAEAAQERGVDVLAIVEPFDGGLDPRARRSADIRLAVHDPGDRLEPDARERRHVAHRRRPARGRCC